MARTGTKPRPDHLQPVPDQPEGGPRDRWRIAGHRVTTDGTDPGTCTGNPGLCPVHSTFPEQRYGGTE
jgi:hypothetical protein